MENWLGIFLTVIFGALGNLVICFFVLRGLASLAGVSAEMNTSRRALVALVKILPVAGAGGLPFFILPFIGPIFGTVISGFVAAMMIGEEYEVSQGTGAKIILPVVVVAYVVAAAVVYYGVIPLLVL